jgi:hypothetical protein
MNPFLYLHTEVGRTLVFLGSHELNPHLFTTVGNRLLELKIPCFLNRGVTQLLLTLLPMTQTLPGERSRSG